MKKWNGAKRCYGLSVLLAVGFVISTVTDYSRYDSTLNSAPFSVCILINAVCFIAPAILVAAIGFFIGKKEKSK